MKKFFWINLCIMCVMLLSLTGCGKQEEVNIENKLDAELEYTEDLIFKIANKHAKGEYIEDEEFKWDYIKGDIQKINNLWSTLVLDLTEVHVNNQDILAFSDDLNELLISVSQEDQIKMLDNLSKMYGEIIKFRDSYSDEKNSIKKHEIKKEVFEIYCLATKQEFSNAKAKADTVIETYKGLMNDNSYAEENSYNLNKIYVLLEEYSKSIETENYDLVRMKYIVTVENL